MTRWAAAVLAGLLATAHAATSEAQDCRRNCKKGEQKDENGCCVAAARARAGGGAASTKQPTLLASIEDAEWTVESTDGTRMASCHQGTSWRLWDIETGAQVAAFEADAGWMRKVALSRSGAHLAIGSAHEPYETTLWDTASGKRVAKLAGSEPLFSDDGSRLATRVDSTWKLWDTKSGKSLGAFEGNYLTMNRDGSRLAIETSKGTLLWDPASKKSLGTFEGGYPRLSPDGSRLVTETEANDTKLWDATTGKLLATLQGEGGVGFSADGSRYVTDFYTDQDVKLWDAATGKLVAVLNPGGGSGQTRFSADGSRIATCDQTSSFVWLSATGKRVAKLKGQTPKLSPDGSHVSTHQPDDTVKVWNVRAKSLVATLKGFMWLHGLTMVGEGPDYDYLIWDLP